jgi:hypothetical protein
MCNSPLPARISKTVPFKGYRIYTVLPRDRKILLKTPFFAEGTLGLNLERAGTAPRSFGGFRGALYHRSEKA